LFQTEVSDSVAVACIAIEVAARFGRIDIVVNNARSIVQRTLPAEAEDVGSSRYSG